MNELYEITNPVFNTAKMTLTLLDSVGNEDAAAFKRILGLEGPHVSGQTAEVELLGRIGAITIEMRYALANRMIETAGNKSVLDLACGYTPRVKYLTDKGYQYIGGDLPAVAEDMMRVSRELLGGKELFLAVDVTNGDSVRRAADRLSGPVTISCEGLVSYLNRSELTAMVSNFSELLAERGGCWITTDFESDDYFMVIARALAGDDSGHFMDMVTSQVIKKTADANHAPVFADNEEKLEFLRGLGLKVERRPITDLSSLGLRTLLACTPEQQAAMEEAMSRIHVWIMTPAKEQAKKSAGSGNGGLQIEQSLEDAALTLRLGGRLDSISAPELLGAFRTITGENTVRDITLDLADLEYTSSAGLRVMLLMYKHVGAGHFRLLHVNETIADILETTGFGEYFGS